MDAFTLKSYRRTDFEIAKFSQLTKGGMVHESNGGHNTKHARKM